MSVFGYEISALLVALAILFGLLGLFAAMALFARNYIKVPPSTVASLDAHRLRQDEFRRQFGPDYRSD